MASPGPWAQSPLPGISFCRPAGQTTHNSKVIYINCCIHSWCWVLCLQYVNGMLFWIRNYSCLGWLGCSLQTTSATFHCPNLDTSIRCAVYIHAVIGWMYVLVVTWSRDMVWYHLTHCTKSALSRIKDYTPSTSVPFEHCVFHDHAFSVIGINFLWVELHENYTGVHVGEWLPVVSHWQRDGQAMGTTSGCDCDQKWCTPLNLPISFS